MPAYRGQSILEYIIIVSLVTVVLYYVGTGVKRGVQSIVKVTADQVGNQAQADQDFNDSQQGFLTASNTLTQGSGYNQVSEAGSTSGAGNVDVVSTTINDTTETQTNTITNAGFTQEN